MLSAKQSFKYFSALASASQVPAPWHHGVLVSKQPPLPVAATHSCGSGTKMMCSMMLLPDGPLRDPLVSSSSSTSGDGCHCAAFDLGASRLTVTLVEARQEGFPTCSNWVSQPLSSDLLWQSQSTIRAIHDADGEARRGRSLQLSVSDGHTQLYSRHGSQGLVVHVLRRVGSEGRSRGSQGALHLLPSLAKRCVNTMRKVTLLSS